MFDDPIKELKEQAKQLLEEEKLQDPAMLDEVEFEVLYNEILAEFGPQKTETPAEPPVRNDSGDYGSDLPPVPDVPRAVQEEELPPAPAAEEDLPPEPAAKKTRGRGNGGLVVTLLLEALAISAVLGLWILSLKE